MNLRKKWKWPRLSTLKLLKLINKVVMLWRSLLMHFLTRRIVGIWRRDTRRKENGERIPPGGGDYKGLAMKISPTIKNLFAVKQSEFISTFQILQMPKRRVRLVEQSVVDNSGTACKLNQPSVAYSPLWAALKRSRNFEFWPYSKALNCLTVAWLLLLLLWSESGVICLQSQAIRVTWRIRRSISRSLQWFLFII